MYICIAGKNKCAINAIKFLLNTKISKNKILALPNNNDDGKDSWQPSFKKFAKNRKIKIVGIKDIYSLKNLFFFSLEYDKIIKVEKFNSKNLYNLHFSLLPKYRGCHTNFLQILNGEKFSGVTLHRIDEGADTGPIWAQKKIELLPYDTAKTVYDRLQFEIVELFKKKWDKIKSNKLKPFKQVNSSAVYHKKNELEKLDQLNLDEKIRVKDLINLLRARSFGDSGFAFYNQNGKKVFLNLRLSDSIHFN